MRVIVELYGRRQGEQQIHHFSIPSRETSDVAAQQRVFTYLRDNLRVRGLEFGMSADGYIVLAADNDQLTPAVVSSISGTVMEAVAAI